MKTASEKDDKVNSLVNLDKLVGGNNPERRKKICWIRAGGTIDQITDKETWRLRMATKEELINSVAGLDKIADFDRIDDVIEPIDSSDMVPSKWQKIARYIISRYDSYDGFVISHGTDTLHYTSAALSIMLHGSYKPIVLTGSMVPLTSENSDAPKNMHDAFMVASKDIHGTYIVFNSRIVYGDRARKKSPQEFDAFESINRPDVGKVNGTEILVAKDSLQKILYDKTDYMPSTDFSGGVGLIKLFPGMNPDVIRFYGDAGYKGVVMELFGSGGGNTQENSMLDSINYIRSKGVLVFGVTQCMSGAVKLDGDDAYDVSYKMKKAGVIGLDDMTSEYAVVKLMSVLANNKDESDVIKAMTDDS